MRILLALLVVAISGCNARGDHRATQVAATSECSPEALSALRDNVRSAKIAYKPLGAAADRDPNETNSAAAAAAVADIVAAEATLDITRDACRR